VEDVCVYNSSKAPLHVFAASTHAHNFGHVISGYKYIPKVRHQFSAHSRQKLKNSLTCINLAAEEI
jgi:hypothetical protein